MPFALFLFDLDGTLVDSLPDIAAALNAALSDAGLPPLAGEVVRGLVGEGVERLAEKALGLAPATAARPDAAALARDIVRRYEERPCGESRLYPQIGETVEALRARGARLAVVTNKPGRVARPLIEALGLGPVMDAVVGDGDGFPRKPAPDAARALMARFGVPPQSTLVVGDGLPDLAQARAVPCPVAAATWGYTDRARLLAQSPDFVVERASELLALV